MVLSQQLSPGMTISISGKIYRVESSIKVTVPKGVPFIKAKLRNMHNGELVEKNLKLNQEISDAVLEERPLEFLYVEGPDYLFLDIQNLEQVLVPKEIITQKIHYLKEGVLVTASFYGDSIFAVDLPQFLELMVVKIDGDEKSGSRMAGVETGAEVEVPPFIEVGDIIKIATANNEYIQRV